MRQVVAEPSIEFDLEPSATELAPARATLRGWLQDRGIHEGIVGELEVVAVELLSNAAEATPAGGNPVHFVARHDGSSVQFEVSNHARPDEDWEGERPPQDDPMRDRGRGLEIVDALSDAVAVNALDQRTVVRCMRVLDQPG